MNLDIGGFLTSVDFLTQLASIITAVFTTLLGEVLANVFGGTGG